MRSSSPGSWADLLWRLRAESAAAEAGDLQAVACLAAGTTLDGPPPDLATAAEAIHLHLRLVRRLTRQLEQTQRRALWLTALPDRPAARTCQVDARG